jgi:hypothetical protein
MTEQQNHLAQLVEQRDRLSQELEKLGSQSTKTRDLLLKTQGAIEYLNVIGVTLPEPEVNSETEEISEEPAES